MEIKTIGSSTLPNRSATEMASKYGENGLETSGAGKIKVQDTQIPPPIPIEKTGPESNTSQNKEHGPSLTFSVRV